MASPFGVRAFAETRSCAILATVASCYRCGRIAGDPAKGPSPWARGVVGGEQVLVCPACQREHPEWLDEAESCPVCGSKRLVKALGDRVCRSCGHQWNEERFRLE